MFYFVIINKNSHSASSVTRSSSIT